MGAFMSDTQVAEEFINKKVIKYYLVAALAWLMLGMLAGFVQAFRLTSPHQAEFLKSISWLSF